jgi:uncharacterized protein
MSDHPHDSPGREADPEQLRLAVSRVLLGGVLASAVLLVIGLATAALVGWEGSLTGAPPPTEPVYTLPGLLAGLAALQPVAIAQLGLFVLILTPIVRVIASLVLFAEERDRVYVLISLGVLAILLSSLLFVR